MEWLQIVIAKDSAATAAGFVGTTCYAVWPLFRARSTMLATYVGNNLAFVVHYALLGHWTAAAMNGLMSIQTLLAIGLVRAPSLRWIYYALMPVLGMASLVTWRGTPSLLSLAAAALSTLGRMQSRETILRALLLAAAPFWAAHDLIVGSLPGLIADLLGTATGITMLLRNSTTFRATSMRAAQRPSA